ncbi:hypothetical protein COY62_03590 [bacterium (Candidatus Howlettbacteria) CG_4_10_14_0_8_um_filter_40_9]|nr:MAG: hypothetical protein COY62_03590 [bacterium (Candidatus Howlettbacteria) CG_4_10_14_0_8_um_filter_40_9]
MNLIGIDIGRSKSRVALGNEKGKIKKAVLYPTDPENIYDDLVSKIIELAPKNIDAIAVGITSISSDEGRVDFDISRKANARLEKKLKKRFEVPVVLENDADTASLGEAVLGAGRGEDTVVYVGIGSGVGVGIVKGERIFENTDTKELGHIVIEKGGLECRCGGKGHLEAYISGTAIKKRFGKEQNDYIPKKIWEDIVKYLAKGLLNIIEKYSPNMVVIGGGVANQSEMFLPITIDILSKSLPKGESVQIKKSKFGDRSGLVGALILAKRVAEEKI